MNDPLFAWEALQFLGVTEAGVTAQFYPAEGRHWIEFEMQDPDGRRSIVRYTASSLAQRIARLEQQGRASTIERHALTAYTRATIPAVA